MGLTSLRPACFKVSTKSNVSSNEARVPYAHQANGTAERATRTIVYRVYDIEAGPRVISRDVNFDESAFGLSMLVSDEAVDGLDPESLDLDDEDPRPRYFQQTAKRKAQSSHDDEAASILRAVHPRLDLEEASAPDDRS